MKSITKISKQTKRKKNIEIVETILKTKKNKFWKEIAEILSGPRRKMSCVNLDRINKESKAGETIVVPGKVLSQGELDKKIKVVAFGFSENAKGKIAKSKSEISTFIDEVKKNPEAKGIKVIR